MGGDENCSDGEDITAHEPVTEDHIQHTLVSYRSEQTGAVVLSDSNFTRKALRRRCITQTSSSNSRTLLEEVYDRVHVDDDDSVESDAEADEEGETCPTCRRCSKIFHTKHSRLEHEKMWGRKGAISVILDRMPVLEKQHLAGS